MLLNSLILFILFNSITLRRDKSILYSRIAIIILGLSTAIAYDSLSILFLRGIGIVGELSYTSTIINSFYIFVLFYLIITTIKVGFVLVLYLILNVFYLINCLVFCWLLSLIWINIIIFKWLEYIGDPTLLFKSTSIQTSSFYDGKGKGKEKANLPLEPESPKSEVNSEDYDSDSDYSKAVKLSLQPEKQGESSKVNQTQENFFEQEKSIEKETSFRQEKHSVQENFFESIAMDTQRWKFLKNVFKKTAIEHNDLKIKLAEKNNNATDIEKSLVELKKKADQLNSEIQYVEKKLLTSGVDPNEQYGYSTDSESGSESYYSSDYKSSNSDTRPNKKVKYEYPDNKFNIVLGFSIFKFGLDTILIVRFLVVLIPIISILILELDIFFNIEVPYITIDELLIIVFIIKSIKLINKWKNTIIHLYDSYLNKDYFIIYTNLYISIIMILLLFSEYKDVYTFLL